MTTIHEALILLVQHNLLQPTFPELLISESDVIQRRVAVSPFHSGHDISLIPSQSLKKAKFLEKGRVMPTAPEMVNIQAQAMHETREERDNLRSTRQVLNRTAKVGKKKNKKSDTEEFDYSLTQDVALRINHDRYGVLLRDEMVVKAAQDRWNKGAAEVVKAVLEASLDDESSIMDSRTHKDVGFNEIIERIPAALYPTLVAGLAGSSSKPTTEIVKQYLSILAGEDQMLANGGAFLRREGSSTNPGYRVELESVCVRLRASLLSELVRQRLGDKAARVLAVVAKAQKASETTVRFIRLFSFIPSPLRKQALDQSC